MDFYAFCEDFAMMFISVGEGVYSAFTTPLSELSEMALPDWIVGILPESFMSYTLINIMFGAGLPILITIIVVKYFIS